MLVGVIQQEHTEEQVNEYLAELAFLAETAGAIAIKVFKQRLPHPDSKTFVGKGKLEGCGRIWKDKVRGLVHVVPVKQKLKLIDVL